MLSKPTPILVAERFPPLLDALLGLLGGLSESDWGHPTAAAGWSVKDVALHLLADEMGNLSARRDRFFEPQAELDGWDALVDWLNRRNQAWVEATRRISPRLLCDLLRLVGEQANAYFASLDPFELGGAVGWAGPQRAPVWLDVAREFTERWHHQQHIREAVGAPGLTDPYYLAPVLATFVHALPRTYAAVDAPQGTAVTLVISGPSGGVWTVMRERASWALYAGRADLNLAEIILPEDAAWRLFTRGLSASQARARASLLGDASLAEKMLEMIAIIA